MIKKMRVNNKILLFLKGFLMGICDIIPGISGGTIAFITGIYARLINAVKNFSLELLLEIIKYSVFRKKENKEKLKEGIRKLDLQFLIILFLGIATAILVGSRLISFFLEKYFVFTISFFIGLILASSQIIFKHIRNHKSKNVLFGVVGFVIGILLAILIPINITPSLWYVFLGGFIGISAMFLPGISGAFILLIMGIYEFMINALHDISGNLIVVGVFMIGAILGAFVISRIISFLFKKDKCKTLYFLLGLVVGALSIPIKNIYRVKELLGITEIIIMLVLLIIGIILVRIVNSYQKDVFKSS